MPQNDDSSSRVPLHHLVDALCDEFESDWKSGNRPSLTAYLQRTQPVHQSKLVKELIALDINYRRLQGETPTVREYVELIPQFQELVQSDLANLFDSGSQSLESTKIFQGPPPRPETAATQTWSGVTIANRYRLNSQLGRGGFGEVWKAQDTFLNRDVAVKVPRLDRAFPPQVIETFLAEARRVAQISVPGVVQVFDSGVIPAIDQSTPTQSLYYIVSEYIEGETLESRARRDPLSHDAAVRIVMDVARAVHRVHTEHDIIHRDIKPSNILLDRQGNPHLADFGLATTEHELLDATAVAVGTVAYMSPEQARGLNSTLDVRSDVYSLGVVLFRLLTGRLPFLARTKAEYISLVLSGRPQKTPRQIDRSISIELDSVCRDCLALDPSGRISSAELLDARLRALKATSHRRMIFRVI